MRAETTVERGAKYLDLVMPDWFRRVNLRTLQMDRGRRCVLGQCYGTSYSDALEKLPKRTPKLQRAFAVDHGFHPGFGSYDVLVRRYGALDTAWRAAITARRTQARSKRATE